MLGQGIHNLFIVIPQFLVTGLSSIVFALLDPDKSVLHGYHPGNEAPQQSARAGGSTVQEAAREDGGTDSIAIIFRWVRFYSPQWTVLSNVVRLGGIAAVVAFVLCYRLAKDLKRH